MAKGVEPDQTLLTVASDQGLRKLFIWIFVLSTAMEEEACRVYTSAFCFLVNYRNEFYFCGFYRCINTG